MATSKLNSQNLRHLVKDIIFPQNELTRRQDFILGGDRSKSKILVEFSSPNIAKPFHYGHLKSTIFGNYLANLHTHLGLQVTRLNYLGDWGTQFGLLGLQLKNEQCDLDEICKLDNPMTFLVQKYVDANERSKREPEFLQLAKTYFKSIERDQSNENPAYVQWKKIKTLSMDELESSYNELNVTFDDYDYESRYSRYSLELVNKLLAAGYAFKSEDGAVIARVYNKSGQTVEVPLIKSDGSSLYLSRDLAALFARKKRYNFDLILYVAGADQARHFSNLKAIVSHMKKFHHDDQGRPVIQNEEEQIVHVKTGKVIGMSTRSGNFLLLSDLIKEAKSRYVITTRNTATSKLRPDQDSGGDQNSTTLEEVAKQLALSAIFYYDLRFKRMRNYSFDWNSATADGSASGLNLQATHARLCSLLAKSAREAELEKLDDENHLRYEAIECQEAINLLTVMSTFNETLRECYATLESAPLVIYSSLLCRAINKARKCPELRVLGEASEMTARSRLSLFASAKDQLALVINLMGLRALERV